MDALPSPRSGRNTSSLVVPSFEFESPPAVPPVETESLRAPPRTPTTQTPPPKPSKRSLHWAEKLLVFGLLMGLFGVIGWVGIEVAKMTLRPHWQQATQVAANKLTAPAAIDKRLPPRALETLAAQMPPPTATSSESTSSDRLQEAERRIAQAEAKAAQAEAALKAAQPSLPLETPSLQTTEDAPIEPAFMGPKIIVHYRQQEVHAAQSVQNLLQGIPVVLNLQLVQQTPTTATVRYFHQEDRQTAQDLSYELGGSWRLVDFSYMTNPPPLGTIEVWIPPGY